MNKKIIAGIIVLVLVLGGSGVVAASDKAIPGDFLFPVDLALEKIQIKFSADDQKEELKFRFAEERVAEIRDLAEKKGISALTTNLSVANITEIEAEIFTNETLVKVEANNQKHGFITTSKVEAEIIKEVAVKFSLTEEKVRSVIVFNKENRASRAEDKEFLNRLNSVVFSERENDDVNLALTDVSRFLTESSDLQKNEQIQKILNELFVLLGDDANIKIEKKDGEIRIESDSGRIKIKFNDSSNNSSDDSLDDNSFDDNSNSLNSTPDASNGVDVRERASEVFCRGEWRDPEDCNNSLNSVDDNSSGGSGRGGNDDDGVSGSNDDNSVGSSGSRQRGRNDVN